MAGNEGSFDDLLSRMPAIAKAVNAFESEAVQRQAFEALVGARGAALPDSEPESEPEEEATDGVDKGRPVKKKATKKAAKPKAGASKRAAVTAPRTVPDLNLRPSGKDSFKDFVKGKKPKSNDEKNTVVLYYLKHELGIEKVSTDHVFTAYREMRDDWRTPNNIRNSLQVTKSTKGWIDTSDMDDITLPVSGSNMVEHDLPKSSES